MDRAQLQDLIQADLDGELSVAERAELARLLLRDPQARNLHEEFRRTDQLLRDIPAAEPPPGLRAAILAGRALSAAPGRSCAQAVRAAALPAGGGRPRRTADRRPRVRPARWRCAGVRTFRDRWVGPETRRVAGLSRCRTSGLSRRKASKLGCLAPARRTIAQARARRVVRDSLRAHRQGRPLEGKPGRRSRRRARDDGERPRHRRGRTGRRSFVLEFSGVAPIQLQLHAGGRLLGEGELSVSEP